MKTWSKDIDIDAPLQHVWSFLDGSFENMQKIMPQVVEHTPVKVTEDKVGSIYRQKYKEGSRIEEYDVETLEYVNEDDQKRLKIGFMLANMFEITGLYELRKINDQQTNLRYTVTNTPLKWYVKLFLVFANDKVVVKFLERVKHVAESE